MALCKVRMAAESVLYSEARACIVKRGLPARLLPPENEVRETGPSDGLFHAELSFGDVVLMGAGGTALTAKRRLLAKVRETARVLVPKKPGKTRKRVLLRSGRVLKLGSDSATSSDSSQSADPAALALPSTTPATASPGPPTAAASPPTSASPQAQEPRRSLFLLRASPASAVAGTLRVLHNLMTALGVYPEIPGILTKQIWSLSSDLSHVLPRLAKTKGRLPTNEYETLEGNMDLLLGLISAALRHLNSERSPTVLRLLEELELVASPPTMTPSPAVPVTSPPAPVAASAVPVFPTAGCGLRAPRSPAEFAAFQDAFEGLVFAAIDSLCSVPKAERVGTGGGLRNRSSHSCFHNSACAFLAAADAPFHFADPESLAKLISPMSCAGAQDVVAWWAALECVGRDDSVQFAVDAFPLMTLLGQLQSGNDLNPEAQGDARAAFSALFSAISQALPDFQSCFQSIVETRGRCGDCGEVTAWPTAASSLHAVALANACSNAKVLLESALATGDVRSQRHCLAGDSQIHIEDCIFVECPSRLILWLSPFAFDQTTGLGTKQTFRIRLDSNCFEFQELSFTLQAILVHVGDGLAAPGAHFFCLKRGEDGFWDRHDDSVVTKASLTDGDEVRGVYGIALVKTAPPPSSTLPYSSSSTHSHQGCGLRNPFSPGSAGNSEQPSFGSEEFVSAHSSQLDSPEADPLQRVLPLDLTAEEQAATPPFPTIRISQLQDGAGIAYADLGLETPEPRPVLRLSPTSRPTSSVSQDVLEDHYNDSSSV